MHYGIFPNIETLIPEKYLLSLKFNKEELISAIDRVSIFVSNELSNIIKLNINNHNSVEFSSSSNEIGGAVEEVSLLSKFYLCILLTPLAQRHTTIMTTKSQ